jgi:hypothetical protein
VDGAAHLDGGAFGEEGAKSKQSSQACGQEHGFIVLKKLKLNITVYSNRMLGLVTHRFLWIYVRS